VERLVVPSHLQRSLRHDEDEAERSARVLLGVLARQLARNDLDCVHVLDIGCGVKLTQALVNDGLPIGSYTGIDVSAPVIGFLRSSVEDPRFTFHHVDFHNARYNPTGLEMTPDAVLPVERADFDLICAFSLVTHLAPDDTKSILAISARYAHDRTRLVFTAFLDVHTEGGHGLVDRYSQALGGDVSTGEPYRDYVADDVLRVALYSEPYMRELVAQSPWELVSIADPTPYAQHLLTLRPRRRNVRMQGAMPRRHTRRR
jgi:SAM-dependent methyltransferase